MIYDIKCSICALKIGEISNQFFDSTETDESLGLADNRCPTCESSFGKYAELHDFYDRHIDNKGAEAFIKQNRKAQDFSEVLLKEYPKRMIYERTQWPKVEMERKNAEKKLGIDKLSPEEKIEELNKLK